MGRPTPTICALVSECLTTLPLEVFMQRNFVADFRQEYEHIYSPIRQTQTKKYRYIQSEIQY